MISNGGIAWPASLLFVTLRNEESYFISGLQSKRRFLRQRDNAPGVLLCIGSMSPLIALNL
jgi:hypothetical protein